MIKCYLHKAIRADNGNKNDSEGKNILDHSSDNHKHVPRALENLKVDHHFNLEHEESDQDNPIQIRVNSDYEDHDKSAKIHQILYIQKVAQSHDCDLEKFPQ